MKRGLIVIGAFAGLALLLAVVGALLPVGHTARVRLQLRQPPAAVYATIVDVEDYPDWRTGVDSLTIVSPGPPLRWRESSAQGSIEFEQVVAAPPRLVRSEIKGAQEQGFGGTWTWDLAPRPDGGTTLTITERGEIYNPLFRLRAQLFFSPYETLEQYARDLASRLGETAVPERLDQ
jgi:uncharacterized protein YndB with AHSA1/START domain